MLKLPSNFVGILMESPFWAPLRKGEGAFNKVTQLD